MFQGCNTKKATEARIKREMNWTYLMNIYNLVDQICYIYGYSFTSFHKLSIQSKIIKIRVPGQKL